MLLRLQCINLTLIKSWLPLAEASEGEVKMRTILAMVMMMSVLSGGSPQTAAANTLRDGLLGLTGHKSSYVSTWDGQRISVQAMRQVM